MSAKQVTVTSMVNGREAFADVCCETHGRELAARLEARWPEIWEPAAVTRRGARAIVVRVQTLEAGVRCEVCDTAAAPAEAVR